MTTEHNSWDCYAWPTRLANVVTYPLDDRRIAVSDDAVTSVPRLLRGHSEVLVHGIDLAAVASDLTTNVEVRAALRTSLGIDPATPVVLVVANHRAEKGWDILLAAIGALVQDVPDVVVLGVGHGQLEQHHRDEVRRLGLAPNVRLLGYRNDVRRLLATADVFALGSRQEGLPVAVMEALAAGLPVVAPNVGGLGQAVTSRSGRLVPPEDPASLAVALREVLSDQQVRRRLSEGALEDAARFDVRRSVHTLEGHYEQLNALRR